MVRRLVEEEVRRVLAAHDATPAADACIGGCVRGWLPCGLCWAGALPTWDSHGMGWRECPRCSGSGEPGFLRCPVCAVERSGGASC